MGVSKNSSQTGVSGFFSTVGNGGFPSLRGGVVTRILLSYLTRIATNAASQPDNLESPPRTAPPCPSCDAPGARWLSFTSDDGAFQCVSCHCVWMRQSDEPGSARADGPWGDLSQRAIGPSRRQNAPDPELIATRRVSL